MQDFNSIRRQLDRNRERHEGLVRKSRDIVILSKQIIYSIHRKNLRQADMLASRIRKEVAKLRPYKGTKLEASGGFKVAIQEYVEAVSYLEFVKHKRLLSLSKLRVDPEYYLMGLCDLTGELVRRAVNSGIDENYKEVFDIHSFVSELYMKLMKFDFFNGELRKKFDSIKWDLKKLDEMVFQLRIKGIR